MDLGELKRNWDALGRRDALGAILSYPLRLDDWRLEEFLATGEREVADVLESAGRYGLPRGRETALDFGCGVGRLTQAMCRHFEQAHGVDIAPSMLEQARALNRYGDRCTYHLNVGDSLEGFGDGTIDFAYSNITLQHMAPVYARRYVIELVRVLRPGGLLVFQLPSEREQLPKLPRKAVIAELAVEGAEEGLVLPAGRPTTLRVRVRNGGRGAWPGRPGLRELSLGNHWLDAQKRLVQLDDGRTPLGRDVEPGVAVELPLQVIPPRAPGQYVLELDLVQEGVAWFAQRRRLSRRRSRPLRVPVEVLPPDQGPLGAPAGDSEPRMEMYGMPRSEVEALLRDSGAALVEVVANDAAGPGWVSLRYTATKER